MARARGGRMQEQILQIATELFSQKGFDGVSVRDVARAARVTLPTIYHHFGDKRSLYMESCVQLFNDWGQHHGRLLARDGAPAQRLFDYFASLCHSLASDRKFSSLLQREILERDTAGIRKLTRSTFRVHFEQVTQLCRELGCRGNVGLTAHTIFALTFGLAQLRPIARELGVGKSIQRAEAMARHVLGVVLPELDWSELRFGSAASVTNGSEAVEA
ncbi:MAG TPA: TetR/AcrR family transcriptional regulator [Steroidobacteraceae bacterium]|nr:TetR/AcrR family transcriptional regulator [Steroidobacteraceae bacterium]